MLERAEMKSILNSIPILQELAGRVIKKFKINYVGLVPNNLMRYLDFSLRCCCQTYCFADHIAYAGFNDLKWPMALFASLYCLSWLFYLSLPHGRLLRYSIDLKSVLALKSG